MKSVYLCSKPDGTPALAVDLVAVTDPKFIGSVLKLAGEAGMIIDRVDRTAVVFEDPIITRVRQEEAEQEEDNQQPELPLDRPLGPADMGEGFACHFSGECPNEKLGCNNCEHAGSSFAPGAVNREGPTEQSAQGEPAPELTPEQAAEWGEKMQAALEAPTIEETLEIISEAGNEAAVQVGETAEPEYISEVDGLPVSQEEPAAITEQF